MSSKFSHSRLRPKPPGICRASPPPPPPWEPPFDEQIFQGYVIFNAPHMTPEGSLTGSMLLTPTPTALTWTGLLVGVVFSIQAELRWHTDDLTMSYDLEVTASGFPHGSFSESHRRARSIDPFDGGEISFEPPPLDGRVACHFWW